MPRPAYAYRVVLIGCGKTKLPHPAQARDLYIGPLFKARRRHAESTRRLWFIVSAKFGLVAPETIIEPYDVCLAPSYGMPQIFGARVLKQLAETLSARGISLADVDVEIHAGRNYADGLRTAGARVSSAPVPKRYIWPVEGLGVGKQLAFYARRSGEHFDPVPLLGRPIKLSVIRSVKQLTACLPPRLVNRPEALAAKTGEALLAIARAELAKLEGRPSLLAARFSVQRFAWRCEGFVRRRARSASN